MRKLFFILFFAILADSVYGREFSAYSSRWQTRPLVGVNIPITKLFKGAETDYLLSYDDRSFYWQILSVSYFFNERWGLEFNFQAGTSSRIRQRANNFVTNMQLQYSDNHYVRAGTGADFDEFHSMWGDFHRGYLGIIYRFERNRFFIYPKFSIGLIEFSTDWGSANLMQKNSNFEHLVSYSRGIRRNGAFIIYSSNLILAPSVSFGYKLSKRFFLNADVKFSYFRPNFTYEKTTTNLFTQQSTVEHFRYRKDIFTLSLGVGLIFVIN
ncbi:MAG: hypothetical protein FWD02_04870 [Bacteroidales bacterium]|nr:hypothetical protein [Bacteroidales bacterium]